MPRQSDGEGSRGFNPHRQPATPAPTGRNLASFTAEMALKVGIFVVPDASDQARTVEIAMAADRAGLDVVAIQDHPYQRRFLDTWTLLSFLGARTERIRLVPDVLNLPLRLPSMIAKSVASLDVLTGGRVELGIGAGAFWEAVEAMGGPRRSPGESVDALEEAIRIIRGFLDGERSLRLEGAHYRVAGAKPGPPPVHPVGIWIGAYGPRMLRLTGRLGDGWLPSVGAGYLAPEDAADRHATIDEAAESAGRDPAEIARIANIGLGDDPRSWLDPERLARTASQLRFDTLLVSVPGDDPIDFLQRLGQDAAPAARQLLG
jgi:alkanesulfonate monooxygenase SsuD/methylene tetrahydromethanopterin reductase-like flavin-dependent oxidoreductase (luciferase family)